MNKKNSKKQTDLLIKNKNNDPLLKEVIEFEDDDCDIISDINDKELDKK
jgi:hypothetical protein